MIELIDSEFFETAVLTGLRAKHQTIELKTEFIVDCRYLEGFIDGWRLTLLQESLRDSTDTSKRHSEYLSTASGEVNELLDGVRKIFNECNFDSYEWPQDVSKLIVDFIVKQSPDLAKTKISLITQRFFKDEGLRLINETAGSA